ncbi:Aldo/keto reductase [Panus rudis PR-1116 ss-1]|nr:Aldo/keto reductase [Panus rudis PR-1116 ss-1]
MSAKLPTRKIGDIPVTAIGYGAMGISAFYGSVKPDEERFNFLDELYASGETFWDTADVYGDSELLIGEWFKKTGKRNEIFLATKFGLAGGIPDRRVRADPEYVPEAFNKSIGRLGVDKVDLYYLHRPDPLVPIELTVGAMAELVKAGKVKYLGLSECSVETLRRAHAVHPISAVQVEYSPFVLDIEDEKIGLLKAARELGIAIIAYSPLGRGLLTGRYRSPDDFEEGDFRRMIPKFSKENFPNILKLVDGLKAIGKRHNATAGQVALAWVLAQGEDVIPIPGTTRVENLKENLGALNVKLKPEEIQEIREIAEKAGAFEGERYPPERMKLIFGNTPPLKK